MEIILLWVGFSLLAGYVASGKGRSFLGYFFLSLIISPLIGFILALVIKENKKLIEKNKIESGENRKCPFCAEVIRSEAIVCRYCGKDITQKTERETNVDIKTKKCTFCYQPEIPEDASNCPRCNTKLT